MALGGGQGAGLELPGNDSAEGLSDLGANLSHLVANASQLSANNTALGGYANATAQILANTNVDLAASVAGNLAVIVIGWFAWRLMHCCGMALGQRPRTSQISHSGLPKHAVAANYLIFLRNCRNLFALMSLISMAVWYPRCGWHPWRDVMVKGGQISVAKDLDTKHLTCMAMDTFLRGIVALCFVERLQRQVQRPFQKIAEEKVIQRSLWLTGIPVYDAVKGEHFQLQDEDFKRVSRDLKEAISIELNSTRIGLPKEVKMSVELVPVVDSLDEVSLSLRNATEMMEHYKVLYTDRVHRKGCCTGVLTWWYQRKHAKLEERVTELKTRQKNIETKTKRIAGSAFITFKEKSHSDYFLRRKPHCLSCRAHTFFTFGKPPFTSVTLECMRAPHPSDVVWVNLHISNREKLIRFLVLTSLLFFFMVVLVGPVTISSQIDVIIPALQSKLKTVDRFLSHFEGGHGDGDRQNQAAMLTTASKQMPALILVAINSMVLPDLIMRIAIAVRAVRHSTTEVIQMHLNYTFLVLNAILIPFLGLNSIGALMEWSKNRISAPVSVLLPRIISRMMANSGVFAIRYIMNCACITSTTQLLQIPQILSQAHSRHAARTARECVEAEEKWDFAWGYWYAWALSIFTMGMVMSSAVPSILPCGALFFAMQFCVDRHNLVFGVFQCGANTENLFIIRAIHYLRCVVSLWWFLMAFTIFYNLEREGNLDLPSGPHPIVIWWNVHGRHFLVKALSLTMLLGSSCIPFLSWWNLQEHLFDSQFELVDVSERGLFRRICCCLTCCCLEKRSTKSLEYRNVPSPGPGTSGLVRTESCMEDGDDSDFEAWDAIEATEVEMNPLRKRGMTRDGAQDFKKERLRWDARSALTHELDPF